MKLKLSQGLVVAAWLAIAQEARAANVCTPVCVDTFDSFSTFWTVEGDGIYSECTNLNCSLVLDPPPNSSSCSTRNVLVPLATTTEVRLFVQPTVWDKDIIYKLEILIGSSGEKYELFLTKDPHSASLQLKYMPPPATGDDPEQTSVFYTMDIDTWHEIVVDFDPHNGRVVAKAREVADPRGPYDSSEAVRHAGSSKSITGLRFCAHAYDNGGKFYVDDLSICTF